MNSGCHTVFELNVGGHVYATAISALTQKHPNSTLALLVQSYLSEEKNDAVSMEKDDPEQKDGRKFMCDRQGRLFIDRDGLTFRFILDYLRLGTSNDIPLSTWLEQLIPDYSDKFRLKLEADFYGLQDLSAELDGILTLKDAKEMKVKLLHISFPETEVQGVSFIAERLQLVLLPSFFARFC